MLQKTLLTLLITIGILGCNSSPTVEENPQKLYANLNTYVNDQEVLKGVAEYTGVPAFHWKEIYHNIKNSSADEIRYKVFGKITIPDVITTDKVYVTFGEDVFFSKNAAFPLSDAAAIMDAAPIKHTLFQLDGYVNGKKLTVDTILANVKTNTQGKRYVDFSLVLHIKFLGDAQSKAYARQRAYSILNQHFIKSLDRVVIEIAPNTRDYKRKFGIPAIHAQ